MLCSDRPWLAFLLTSLLLVIWIFGFRTHDAVVELLYNEHQPSPEETAFVGKAVDVEFPTPINYESIQEICARTTFRPGLLFSCEGQHGGVGMVRNQILKCIRYAIHAGAGLVVPSMALRNAKNLADIETSTEMGLEYLFDREAFHEHLHNGCPGLLIYEHPEDFPFYQQRQPPLNLLGSQFEPGYPIQEGLRHTREWRLFFDDWLTQQSMQISSEAPVHVQMGQSFLEYPVHDDGDAFVAEFGKILSFRKDTRVLAAKIIWELKQRFALPIDPGDAIYPEAYYGAHLRLEQDAIWAWPPDEWRFSRMEEQFNAQFDNIQRTGLKVVYVASGNRTVVNLFVESADRRGLRLDVVTKDDLLIGADRRLLEDMTFDQRALVDFLVMFKASAFMGVAYSSFPWTVALRRHELSRCPEYANEGSDLLRDEHSVIMGLAADYPDVDPFVISIWP
jgi:hypothetical protein